MGRKTQGVGSARDAEAGSPVSCGPRLRARSVERHVERTQTRSSKCVRACAGILTGTRTHAYSLSRTGARAGPGSCWLVHLCTTFDISGKLKFEIHCFHLVMSLEQTQSALSLPLKSRGRRKKKKQRKSEWGWWAGGVCLRVASLHALRQDTHSSSPAPRGMGQTVPVFFRQWGSVGSHPKVKIFPWWFWKKSLVKPPP